jgi:adenylate cyclase
VFNFKRSLQLQVSAVFGAVVLAVALSLIAFSYWSGHSLVLASAADLIDARLDVAASRTQSDLHDVLVAVETLTKSPWLATTDTGSEGPRTDVLRGVLRSRNQIDGVYVGYPGGEFMHFVSLDRNPAWSERLKPPKGAIEAVRVIRFKQDLTRISFWRFFTTDGIRIGETDPNPADYDPRLRPWFKLAQRRNPDVAWTPPYVFATTGEVGVTVSGVSSVAPGIVIGADYTLADISAMLDQQKPTPGSRIMVFDRGGALLAYSGMMAEEFRDAIDSSGRVHATQIAGVADAVARTLYREVNKAGWSRQTTLRFTVDGRDFIAAGKPSATSAETDQFVAMAVPVDELTQAITWQNLRALGISLFILLVSLPIVIAVARGLSQPLVQLAAEARKIEQFDVGDPIGLRSPIREINQLAESMDKAKAGLRIFGLYMPKALVRQLLASSVTPKLGGDREELTVFFSDIREFTGIAEKTDPEVLITMLSDYFGVAARAIHDNGGSINKFIGDGIMALWNVPRPDPDHALHACQAATQFLADLDAANERLREQGGPILETRIGIHTGIAVVGNVGAEDRLEYTALGDTVNIASRLEGLNKEHGTRILISEAVVKALGDRGVVRPVGKAVLKGRLEPISVFELQALKLPG